MFSQLSVCQKTYGSGSTTLRTISVLVSNIKWPRTLVAVLDGLVFNIHVHTFGFPQFLWKCVHFLLATMSLKFIQLSSPALKKSFWRIEERLLLVFALSLDSCHVPPISCWSLQQSLLFPITGTGTVVIIDLVHKLTNFALLVRLKKINSVKRSQQLIFMRIHANSGPQSACLFWTKWHFLPKVVTGSLFLRYGTVTYALTYSGTGIFLLLRYWDALSTYRVWYLSFSVNLGKIF